MDEKTLKQKFRVAENKDIPTIGRLLVKNPGSVYIQSITKEKEPALFTAIFRETVIIELLFGYYTLHGTEAKTGRPRSLRIIEEAEEGKGGETKKNVVQSHYSGVDGWWPIPFEIAKIYIPR